MKILFVKTKNKRKVRSGATEGNCHRRDSQDNNDRYRSDDKEQDGESDSSRFRTLISRSGKVKALGKTPTYESDDESYGGDCGVLDAIGKKA